MGETLAVLSGKGGTGKSSLCAALACSLAKEGLAVLCIDCDVGLRNLDLALGLSDYGAPSFLDVALGRSDLGQAAIHPKFPTLHFLTAPFSCDESQQEAFAQWLPPAAQGYDFVLLDAPAGIDRFPQMCARLAGRVLLVTGAEHAAIRDARHTADLLDTMGKTNIRLIVNRLRPKLLRSLALTVDDVMDQSGLPLLGLVPEDARVAVAPGKGKSLLEYARRCPAAKACQRIAKRIMGHYVPLSL